MLRDETRKSGNVLCRLRGGCADGLFMSDKAYADYRGGGSGAHGAMSDTKSLGRSVALKIVTVKSPKLFAGFLRRLFGIKKESYID